MAGPATPSTEPPRPPSTSSPAPGHWSSPPKASGRGHRPRAGRHADSRSTPGSTPEGIARLRARQRNRVPLGRVGRPEEVAWWMVALARPEASFATGLVLPVDGGASVVF
ncbi:SDR family oxidoreductase [Microbacterium terregens]|uniref:SDR family oxidoreductase n=1 Tax=Microbacterium terregens TaxID=69363 RepID=UPI003CD058A9